MDNARSQGRALRFEHRLIALKHIRALAEISEAESELFLQGAGEPSVTAAGAELIVVGTELTQPRVILSGWAGLSVILDDGRRQLLDLALPGDLVGFSLHTYAHAKASIICLTAVENVKAPILASSLHAPERLPGLLEVLHRAQDQFEDRLLNQIIRNGRQSAYEKLCSLLLELYARLARAGLAEQHSFELPISQTIIADALGLSPVHVNRTFQHLKRERIVHSEGHRLIILNFAALQEFAGELPFRGMPEISGSSERADDSEV